MSNQQDDDSDVTYRSGAAARLAGLSVETLRVWERRYELSDTRRSAHGQRLYSAAQVQRLGMLKQLVDQGHPIGQLAHLSVERLRELANGDAADDVAAAPIGVVVIGLGLARRIAASGGDALLLDVQASCSRFDQPVALDKDVDTDVLLVELPELDESAVPMIAAARASVGAAAVVVLYRFCSSATIRALRARGWVAARVPAEMGELVPLCRQALVGQSLAPQSVARAASRTVVQPPARRFDDEALATISAAGNRLACECPRHLADLLLMVGSFERYSAQCASRSEDDARLHQDLGQAAAQARVVLEGAMERLARAEGLPLPPARRGPPVRH